MLDLAALILVVFTFCAFADGIYLHLWRYRLFARAESRREHRIHTMNAALFPFTVFPLFAVLPGGALLWGALALFAATMALEIIDVFEERASRASLGGITSGEYALHFGMTALRSSYTMLALASRPLWAWGWDAPFVEARDPSRFASMVGWSVFVSGLFVAGVHLWLARPGERIGASPSSARASGA